MKLRPSFWNLMILVTSLISFSAFAESELSGRYYEKTYSALWIGIDKDDYFSSNLTFDWDSISNLEGRFPHRLKYDAEKKVYFVKGLLAASWELDGDKWDCDYPVTILLDPTSSKEFIDVTVRRPRDIYVPYKKGSCDYSGTYEDYYSFRRKQ